MPTLCKRPICARKGDMGIIEMFGMEFRTAVLCAATKRPSGVISNMRFEISEHNTLELNSLRQKRKDTHESLREFMQRIAFCERDDEADRWQYEDAISWTKRDIASEDLESTCRFSGGELLAPLPGCAPDANLSLDREYTHGII
jgi:hypothetical protein